MAPVFREIELTWDGETYRVTPDIRLLNRIEQRVSLSGISERLMKGEPPMSHVAYVVGEFLRAGGARVSDEEVYAEIMTSADDAVEVLTSTILVAAFPARSGNAPSPAKRGAKPRKRRT